MAQHIENAAVDAPRSLSVDEAAAAFASLESENQEEEGGAHHEEPEAEPETDDAEESGDEPDDTDETGDDEAEDDDSEDDEDEPGNPAIDPPASLTAEEKAAFAQLPPEAQQMIAAVENRRTAEVQQGLEKARSAQREAEIAAASQIAEAERLNAERLAQIAQAYEPQPPDDSLIDQDPRAYLAAKARYDAAKAQHDQYMQQVAAMHEQAVKRQEAIEAETIRAQFEQVKSDLPEASDPQKWQDLLSRLTPLALELGYPEELLADATPIDIRAIKRAATWKQKAEKWDALQARKMQKVRAAKAGKTAKPNAAQPIGSGKARAISKAQQRLKQTGSIEDAAAAMAARFR